MFHTYNPFTDQIIATYPSSSDEIVAQSINQSALALVDWKNSPLSTRIQYIQHVAHLLAASSSLAHSISIETGKRIQEAQAEVDKCILSIHQLCELAPEALSSKKHLHPLPYIQSYEPMGVILGILPWNFPIWQSVRFAVPALLAGNTVLIKPAPSVAASSLALQDLFTRCLPHHIVQTVFAETTQIPTLLSHPSIRGMSFTGSNRTGAVLAAQAGAALKPIVLELGSNDPIVLHSDYPWQDAFHTLLHARLQNNGQSCIAAKRFFVHETILTSFLEKLYDALEHLVFGDPTNPSTTVTTLVHPQAVDALQLQVQHAIDYGATTVYQYPTPADAPRAFFPPTVLVGSMDNPVLHQEELFGPVFSIIPYKTIESAISCINSSPYGLGAAIFTNDPEVWSKAQTQIQSATIVQNTIVSSDARIPMGSVKQSGIGYELGKEGLLSFTRIKIIRY
ncbi:MAG: aldehyde dehydrogenase family protein [Cytophagaceae bacterium]|jgi:succinate-semialdehyde dehydrogenase/glutarate-semialdehyde dehydrogenase|nr:aldehyde dehydrogenase family protein [Cytophagaceae bacterium]